MKTPAEIIHSIEEFYDVETLELQIRYCKTVLKAAIEETEARSNQLQSKAGLEGPAEASTPEGEPNRTPHPKLRPLPLGPVNQCNKTLDMLAEARRYQRLLIKQAVNKVLGPDSPYIQDGHLMLHDEDIYTRYCNLRLGIKPRPARPPRQSALDAVRAEFKPQVFHASPQGAGQGRAARSAREATEDIIRQAIERGRNPVIALARGDDDDVTDAEMEEAYEHFKANGGAPHLRPVPPAVSPSNPPAVSQPNPPAVSPSNPPAVSPSNPTAPITPEVQARYDALADELADWSIKTSEWLNTGDYARPLPELRAEVVSALTRDADTDPTCAQWLEVVQRVIARAQYARMTRLAQPERADVPSPPQRNQADPQQNQQGHGDQQPQTP